MMNDKRRGIVFSSFDLLHAGHIMMLSECKGDCDELIVCIQSDPTIDRTEKNKPIQTLFERWLQLQACDDIDFIIPYSHESDIPLMLQFFKPDVRYLGSDYYNKDFTGKDYCEKVGIELKYCDRSHGLSTSELRQRIKGVK